MPGWYFKTLCVVLVTGVVLSGLVQNQMPSTSAHQTTPCLLHWKNSSCMHTARLIEELRAGVLNVCLSDINTQHTPGQLSLGNKPRHLKWNRHCLPTNYSTFGFTSDPREGHNWCTAVGVVYCIFIALEPPTVQPQVYESLQMNKDKFDLILTLSDTYQVSGPNVVQWPFGSSWLPLSEWQLPHKTRLCSMIASQKNQTIGHQMRHEIIRALNKSNVTCDILGGGYTPIQNKKDGICPYMFTVVVENTKVGKYMTEKLIDALACGAVPLYWGTEFAAKIFPGAIITFNSTWEAVNLIQGISEKKYNSMKTSLATAQQEAHKYVPPERWLWNNVMKCAAHIQARRRNCRFTPIH